MFQLSDFHSGDYVRLVNEFDRIEVTLVVPSGLELADGRTVGPQDVEFHRFITLSEEGEPYWTGRSYGDDLTDAEFAAYIAKRDQASEGGAS